METPFTATPGGQSGLKRHIRLRSATALVIANMIGAGIFTTTGFPHPARSDASCAAQGTPVHGYL